jgi:hypothetical protein
MTGERIEFSTYAFNADRVRSGIDRKLYRAPGSSQPLRRRAYVVSVGVTGTESPFYWSLDFAGRDARRVQTRMVEALTASRAFDEVVPVLLASKSLDGESAVIPTKANLRAVLAILAGRDDSPGFKDFPEGVKTRLRTAAPDDLVVLSFCGHGLAVGGEFYLVPYDIGTGRKAAVTPELIAQCVSGRQLAEWLRPVDAGQMAVILDACYSAAAVESNGFKPAPLGDPGLGQLAYDKRIRVLAASQPDRVANAFRGALLSHALAEEGLGQGNAAHDGRLTLAGLFDYAARRVPELFEERRKEMSELPGEVQRPVLFDFARRIPDVPLGPMK